MKSTDVVESFCVENNLDVGKIKSVETYMDENTRQGFIVFWSMEIVGPTMIEFTFGTN